MANILVDYINALGLNSIPRFVALLLIIVLFYAFYQSPYTNQLRNMKSFKQAGGAVDSTIGMILLMGLTIIAFVLTFNSINMTTLLFIILFMIIGYVVTGNFVLSLAIAVILSSVIIAYSTTGEYEYEDRETFESGEGSEESEESTEEAEEKPKKKKAKKEEKKEAYAEYADDEEDAEPVATKKESFKIPKVDTKLKEEDIMDDEEEEKFIVDQQASMIDIYKSLSSDQVKGMKKDTVELMKTQQELIQTLNSMGPVLEQSKGILSSFQNYFGNDDDMKKKLDQLAKV
jgi:hypothetical protein